MCVAHRSLNIYGVDVVFIQFKLEQMSSSDLGIFFTVIGNPPPPSLSRPLHLIIDIKQKTSWKPGMKVGLIPETLDK